MMRIPFCRNIAIFISNTLHGWAQNGATTNYRITNSLNLHSVTEVFLHVQELEIGLLSV